MAEFLMGCVMCVSALVYPVAMDQAALLANGEWVSQGFKITDYPSDGPLAKLERQANGTSVRGSAEAGDIITHINGQQFDGRDSFLRLLTESYRQRDGKAVLTIRDVRSGASVDWTVRLVLTGKLNPPSQPANRFSLRDRLGPRPEPFRIP